MVIRRKSILDVCSEGLSQEEHQALIDFVLGAHDVFSTSKIGGKSLDNV